MALSRIRARWWMHGWQVERHVYAREHERLRRVSAHRLQRMPHTDAIHSHSASAIVDVSVVSSVVDNGSVQFLLYF